jgi:hypothetical protein
MATRTISGGDKLQAYFRELSRKVGRGGDLKVGFLEGAKYPNGTPVAAVAAIQEFGAPRAGIPPRPFFRNMIQQHKHEWGPTAEALLVQTDYDVERTLELMGEQMVGDLKRSIIDFDEVPLKPATIRRKGFEKQLIDTGHMLNSVGKEIELK